MRYDVRLLATVTGAACLLAAFSSSSLAADVNVVIPTPPPIILPPVVVTPTFNGPYIGLVVGYGVGDKFWDNDPYGPWGTTEHRVSGALVGIEAGFRIQPGAIVFGVEGDWAWTNINGESDCGPNDAYTCTTDLDWLATLTGQAGFALGGNLLVYGEAGLAWADENFVVDGPGLGTPLTGSLVNSGWLLGAGVAVAMNNGLYIKAEYNWINFGTETAEVTGGPTVEFDMTQRLHVFKLGIGYQF